MCPLYSNCTLSNRIGAKSQSGSPLADWAAVQDLLRMQNTSRVYGERLGCVVDKSHKLVECLRSRSFEELGNVRLTVIR